MIRWQKIRLVRKMRKGYDLRKLSDEIYRIYHGKTELYNLLHEMYINTRPAEFHDYLVKYPWKNIYGKY